MEYATRSCRFMAIAISALLLSGCAQTEFASHYIKKISRGQETQSAGAYKVGNPYRVGSVWYYPEENFQLAETGIASWYGPDFHGKKTANGEIYDQNELTAAHRTLQMPSFVRVTNLENGRSVVLRVNDRGPYKHGRVIDVSRRAAELLGFINKGTARVRVEVLEKESRKIAAIAKDGVDTTRMTVASLNRAPQQAAPVTPETLPPRPILVAARPADRGPQVAALGNDAEMLPESLQTPTITVEELGVPGRPSSSTPPPSWQPPPQAAPVQTHVNKGRVMPDPVVTTEPVRPTGIFVQAGSFTVYGNAERLSERLSGIAPAHIEPVTVNGRQFYRVKLGPLASVDQADRVLEDVIAAGEGAARVVGGR